MLVAATVPVLGVVSRHTISRREMTLAFLFFSLGGRRYWAGRWLTVVSGRGSRYPRDRDDRHSKNIAP